MLLYLLLWDNGDMQKVAELLVPDNGKCGADIKQSCCLRLFNVVRMDQCAS